MKWINHVHLFLAYFGYVKIPLEAVQLSMRQEEAFRILINALDETGHDCPNYRKALEGQKTLTAFLRSGRAISI